MSNQPTATVPAMSTRARFRPPPLPSVAMHGFWGRWIETVRQTTAPILRRRCEDAGMYEQIDPDRPVPKETVPLKHGANTSAQRFWDSDFGKIIETAAYCLVRERDPALEKLVDDIVDIYARLQLPDGYMNSWFQRMRPGKRWTNMRDDHELYCAGHMLEGAVAYFQATGKRKLLDIMLRYLEHIRGVIGTGPGQKPGYPGHQEIELALVRLYRLTGDRTHLDLARYFIDQRGQDPKFFELEAQARGEKPGEWYQKTPEYNQWHAPVREQDKVVGHAVRAMYMYSGMADVAAEFGDDSLRVALERLWADLVGKRLYVTGGMGPSAYNEGFTEDYDLPNESAYAETCASVGLVFWARRMLEMSLEGRYGDMMEQALYNGALAGISLDGSVFFYENPLESRGNHHRWKWHRCPCCPPNIARLLASIGTYAYAEGQGELAVHLYGESEATLDIGAGKVRVAQRTRYPWEGDVEFTITPDQPRSFALSLRIPAWSHATQIAVNGVQLDPATLTTEGYARIERAWQPGDTVRLRLGLAVQRLHANPNVRQDAGRVALRRGPIVYCLEGVDNSVPLNSIALPPQAELQATFEAGLLDGVIVLQGTATVVKSEGWGEELYRPQPAPTEPVQIRAVPYFAWDNRAPGEMLVWLREAPAD